MIPIEPSVTPMPYHRQNPAMAWHHAALEHATRQPPPDTIPRTAETEKDRRDHTGDQHGARDEELPADRFDRCEACRLATYAWIKSERRLAAPEANSCREDEHDAVEEKPGELTEAEKEQVRELEERDREVRRHEMAHVALLGPYARGVKYTYQLGPDGRFYAVGGSVDVDTSKESCPAHSHFKAQMLRRAAMGVDSPSPADMAVAARADEIQRESFERITAQA